WQGWYKDAEGRRVFFTLSRHATRRTMLHNAQALEVHHAEIRLGVRPKPTTAQLACLRPMDGMVAEYLAWGTLQGGHGGRPWTPKHARQRASILAWWQEQLHLRVFGDCLGMLPDVERALQHLAATELTSQSLLHYRNGITAFTAWCTTREYFTSDPL